MSQFNLFPYELATINLTATSENISRENETFHLYEHEKQETFKINFKSHVSNIDKSISQNNSSYINNLIDCVLILTSKKSLTRKAIIMQKDENGIYFNTDLEININDWQDEIIIQSYAILKKELSKEYGFAYFKGSKIALSKEFNILIDEPEINKTKKSGKGIDPKLISFKDPNYDWLNEYYFDNIFAIDPSNKSSMPILYLNQDMDEDILQLIQNEDKSVNQKTTSRNLYFQIICHNVLSNLLSITFQKLRDEYIKLGDQGEETGLNAWEEIDEWQRSLIENYISDIVPGTNDLDNAKEIILEEISEESGFVKLLRRTPNIIQNSLDTTTIFQQTIQSIRG